MTHRAPATQKIVSVFCGELCSSSICDSAELNILNKQVNELLPNVTIDFDKFIENPHSLPLRNIDLLLIASYVYCADRLSHRGERDSIDNTSWAHTFNFHIPVFDLDFWTNPKVQIQMGEALKFMTGDRSYTFHFTQATQRPYQDDAIQMNLFGNASVSLDEAENTDVLLFSGGLDSLAGVVERLHNLPERKLCLVSHRSNNVTMKMQDALVQYLKEHYKNRIIHYGFKCRQKSAAPSREETQRTRMFLFSSIAFVLSSCYGKKEFYIYENGITSINLPKQGDVFNARASRTTHPKTIGLLKTFFKQFDSDFELLAPYLHKTKADIFSILADAGEKSIITSSVSCSSTRNKPEIPHCDHCFQCVDRIFAAYASGLSEYDVTYDKNFISQIEDGEAKQRVSNTLRLALSEISKGKDYFLQRFPDEIMDIIPYWPSDDPDDALDEIYSLFCEFGDSIFEIRKRNTIKARRSAK